MGSCEEVRSRVSKQTKTGRQVDMSEVTNKELVTLLGALIDEVIRVSDNAHVYNDETGERVSLVDAVKILNQLKSEGEA